MSCNLPHPITGPCTGFHDAGAQAFAAYSAASDGNVDEAREGLKHFDDITSEGVQSYPEALDAASAVRDWLAGLKR